MSVDRTTDAISHFIGLFEMEVEQARLRDAYEEFTALRAKIDLAPFGPLELTIPTDFELDPGKYGPLRAPLPPEEAKDLAPPGLPGGPGGPSLTHGSPPGLDFPSPAPILWPDAPPPWITAAGLPGSVLSLTVQTALLRDNDVLGSGNFRDPAGSSVDLASLGAVAEALHAPEGFARSEIPDLQAAEGLAAAMAAFSPEGGEGISVFVAHGTEAGERIVNGEEVEDLPGWKDVLPAYHADEEESETDDASPDTDLPDWALPDIYSPTPDMPEGHTLVTGGNLALNEASVYVSWIDAPMIAVGGAWIDLDLVSQVAALSDRDTGAAWDAAGDTAVFQTIEIDQKAHAAPWREGHVPGEGSAPTRISLDVIDGDIVVSNHIEQLIEILDDDHFGMAITGANTAYILGGNTVFNATGLVEAGFAYDLILVTGDFLSVNTIHQTMVLMDDDWFVPSLIEAPKGVWQDDLAVDGAAVAGNAQSGEGLAGIGATPETPTDTAGTGTPEEDTAWDPATDNLMMNQARLTKVGLDTHAELTDSLAEILADLNDDHDALAARLMSDPALAGMENARVLVVNGDLVQSTTIDQTILVSDRDDIRIDGALPPELDLVAGSNALLNAASITEQGVDSLVMAQNEPYSDLLLHQASLIDGGDARTPEPGFASEAVAFLMEETQATVAEQMGDGVAATAPLIGTDAYDVMHGVLA